MRVVGKPLNRLVFLAALLSAGCALPGRRAAPPPPSPDAAHRIVRETAGLLQRFQATCTISFDAGLVRGTLAGRYRLRPPDALAATFRGPFGMKAGRLVVEGGRYEVDTGRGGVVRGRLDSLDLERITGIPFPVDDLMLLFAPIAYIPEDARTVDFAVQGEDSLWFWELATPDGGMDLLLDPRRPVSLRQRWFGENGAMILEKHFAGFSRSSGLYIPHEMRLMVPGRTPFEVVVRLDDYRVNPRWVENPFRFKLDGKVGGGRPG